ncbi:MAG: polysaccharide biosynthesis protein [Clostridia bacterium]|nr:polysaccharide biosynthesis protein [Clostridia bacterium]
MNDSENNKRFHLERWQKVAFLLILYDILAVNLAYFCGLWIRWDFSISNIPGDYLMNWLKFTPIYAVICVAVLFIFRLYRTIWRYASYSELLKIILATLVTGGLHVLLMNLIFGKMPISYYFIGPMLQFVFTGVIRFAYRFILMVVRHRTPVGKRDKVKNIMLIGGGSAGQMILRDVRTSGEQGGRVVCIIDDDQNKWGRYIDGVKIIGGRDEILSAAEKYEVDCIYVAIPSAPASERRDILNICSETGCEMKNLPGMFQLMQGEVTVSSMKKVAVEDLLGREPIKLEMESVFSFISGKTVMVTGGGGSIGSELCRQIAAHSPKQLIIFDIYENSAYAIELELREKYPELDIVALIGSVRDSRRIFGVFKKYRPEIVYHAAAHKHVPLMETSPCEAIKNNALGTYKTAYAAMIHGCRHFVLISTDKAVNPTNIMGASKRLCEMIIQSFDAKIKAGKANELPQLFTHNGYENADKDGSGEVFKNISTEFVAVRFGNVLGSNGSVIPIFKKQIEKGGPVTVTHPDIVRYFMTIPEAVSLVLQAGTYAHGGEIFVLDMGEPVKIDTLARNLIRLSGFKPDVDIKIEYTGLRPGEKLYEEKLMAEEGLRKTENDLIHIGCPIPFDNDIFLGQLEGLMNTAYANSEEKMKDEVAKVVSTYHPA